MDQNENYIGKTLKERYRISELIGTGGMAYVYKAQDLKTGKAVSVKILNEENTEDQKSVQRFKNESEAVSMLDHKNIVKIIDYSFEGSMKYIVMEYVDGITLMEYIEYKGKIDWKEAVYYIRQVLGALGHAHSKGIIHRDVKPQNIMLTREGVVKVMDFGIAKVLKCESITVTDKALGTVNYISPEQASGKKVGFYSDIYSVGVVLYEMTVGKLPFVAENAMAVAMKQITDDPEPPRNVCPEIPEGLEQIILKAMHKDIDERFSSCETMARALEMVSEDPTVVFAEHTAHKTAKPGEKKKSTFLPVIAGVTGAFILAALVTIALVGMKFYKNEFTDNGVDIEIPNLIGQEYSEELVKAYRETERINIILDKTPKTDAQIPKDTILDQSVEAGSTRKLIDKNGTYDVTVTVSAGPGVLVLPDLKNIKYDDVAYDNDYIALDITLEKEKRYDTDILDGYIISTEPGPDSIIEQGGIVKVYVSCGAQMKTVYVPDVTGKYIDEAKHILQERRLSIGEITFDEDSEEAPGVVIDQSWYCDDPNDRVPEKITAIDLVVSTGENYDPNRKDEDDEEDEENTDEENENTEEKDGNTVTEKEKENEEENGGNNEEIKETEKPEADDAETGDNEQEAEKAEKAEKAETPENTENTDESTNV